MKNLLALLIGVLACGEVAAAIPRAYQIVSQQYGVPDEVFFAVALQESGKSRDGKFLPWPWTLNIDNQGFYFDDRESAELALLRAMHTAEKKGTVGRVAVGLGQIYMPSHAKQFASPLDALDPTVNLNYAAKLIATEYLWTVRQGRPDWWVAVGRYHTPSNAALAEEYQERVYSRCLRISNRCSRYGRSSRDISQRLVAQQ